MFVGRQGRLMSDLSLQAKAAIVRPGLDAKAYTTKPIHVNPN